MAKKPSTTIGRADPRGEQFARLTRSLLESEAVATLPPTAFKLLALFALGARGPGLNPRKDKGRNGIQAVTDSHSKKFGFNSRDTVYRGLKTLLERGLIIRTRDGHRSKTHFALYGVAWLPITHWDGEPLDTPKRENDGWRTWKPTQPKAKKKTPNRWTMKKLPSDHRTQSRPIIGHNDPVCRPTMSTRLPLSRPIAGNTLRVLGTPSASSKGSHSGLNSRSPSPSKARELDFPNIAGHTCA